MDNSTVFDWIWHPGFLLCNLPLLFVIGYAVFGSWREFGGGLISLVLGNTNPLPTSDERMEVAMPALRAIVFFIACFLVLMGEYQFLLRTCPEVLGKGLR